MKECLSISEFFEFCIDRDVAIFHSDTKTTRFVALVTDSETGTYHILIDHFSTMRVAATGFMSGNDKDDGESIRIDLAEVGASINGGMPVALIAGLVSRDVRIHQPLNS